mmetsp:Transcript_24423/g.37142  ORF Transcript_24423/g.37142 Transcript_24423/m.37142 type:complete len:118 (+) Transcript_24423:1316-1669(+)
MTAPTLLHLIDPGILQNKFSAVTLSLFPNWTMARTVFFLGGCVPGIECYYGITTNDSFPSYVCGEKSGFFFFLSDLRLFYKRIHFILLLKFIPKTLDPATFCVFIFIFIFIFSSCFF